LYFYSGVLEISDLFNSYTLGLVTLVLWGIAPIFGKLGLGNIDPLPALMIRSAMVTTILIIAVLVTGKWTAVIAAEGRSIIFIALEGLCAALVGQLAYYYAIKAGDVSKVGVIVAGAPLVTITLAFIILHEKITLFKIAGAALVILGIALLRL